MRWHPEKIFVATVAGLAITSAALFVASAKVAAVIVFAIALSIALVPLAAAILFGGRPK
jgi:hypothetical protein